MTVFNRLDVTQDIIPILQNDWTQLLIGGDDISFWNRKLHRHVKERKARALKEKKLKNGENGQEKENTKKAKRADIDPEGHMHPGQFESSMIDTMVDDCFIDRDVQSDRNKLWNFQQCAVVCESILRTSDKTNRRVDKMLDIKHKVDEL